MNAPRYAVYMMLDEPHGNASTHGYATAGWVGGAGGRQGDRADRADARHAAGHPLHAADQQALAIPLQPGRPPGARRAAPVVNAPAIRPVTRRPRHPAGRAPADAAARPQQRRASAATRQNRTDPRRRPLAAPPLLLGD